MGLLSNFILLHFIFTCVCFCQINVHRASFFIKKVVFFMDCSKKLFTGNRIDPWCESYAEEFNVGNW